MQINPRRGSRDPGSRRDVHLTVVDPGPELQLALLGLLEPGLDALEGPAVQEVVELRHEDLELVLLDRVDPALERAQPDADLDALRGELVDDRRALLGPLLDDQHPVLVLRLPLKEDVEHAVGHEIAELGQESRDLLVDTGHAGRQEDLGVVAQLHAALHRLGEHVLGEQLLELGVLGQGGLELGLVELRQADGLAELLAVHGPVGVRLDGSRQPHDRGLREDPVVLAVQVEDDLRLLDQRLQGRGLGHDGASNGRRAAGAAGVVVDLRLVALTNRYAC